MTEDLFEIDPTSSRPRRVAGRLGVWLGLAVMLGLGGLAVWAISDGEPQPGTGDPDDGTTLAVEFGGPYNGFESIGYLGVVCNLAVLLMLKASGFKKEKAA